MSTPINLRRRRRRDRVRVAERRLDRSPFLLTGRNRARVDERIIISASSGGDDALRYVRAAAEGIAAFARGRETITWYVDRDGLEEQALRSGHRRDYFTGRAEGYLHDLLALVAEARRGDKTVVDVTTLRQVRLGSRLSLIADLNRRPAHSVRSLSIYATARADALVIRDRPGLIRDIELGAEEFDRLQPMIFASDASVYLHGAGLSAEFVNRLAKTLGTRAITARAEKAAGRAGTPSESGTGAELR